MRISQNIFEAELAETDRYEQMGAKFDVVKRVDMNQAKWDEKLCDFEIQTAAKNSSEKTFSKLYTFQIDMASYLNQASS